MFISGAGTPRGGGRGGRGGGRGRFLLKYCLNKTVKSVRV